MKIVRVEIPFENRMSRTQTVLGWIYVAMHVAILPKLLDLYVAVSPRPITDAGYNMLYYGVGIAFVLLVMLGFLRRDFDVLADNFRLCVFCIMLALIIQYAMSTAAALILMLLQSDTLENPNNANVMEMAQGNYGVIKALTIFIAPIVEEVLFRGVVFGSIRPKSRGWAYAVSVGLFAAYHVTSYFFLDGDWRQLIYIIQYIPASVALAWAYEHSGSLWTVILYHMGNNALSFAVLNFAERLH